MVDEDDIFSSAEETPKPKARGRTVAATAAITSRKKLQSSHSQSTITSFTSTRKPVARGRAALSRGNHYEESDEEDERPKLGGGWGTANSQSTLRRGRR